MTYLRNCWYVAAWADEVDREPLSRVICETPLVLYRTEEGKAVVLDNRCPHRFAPLSMGKLVGSDIQCGYHGLRFGPDGRCTLNPHGDGFIGPRLKATGFPAAEIHDMIWVWLGDPEKADLALIADFACNTAPEFRRIHGMFEIDASYLLVLDNVLDLSHAEFVHDGILSSDAITASTLETLQEGTTIWSNRWCPNGAAAPAWAMAFDNYDKPVDQWLYMRWDAPATLLLDIGLAPVGASRSEGVWLYGTDIIVPKDDKSCYYFWAFARNYAVDDPAICEFWRQSVAIAFEQQDRSIIEGQQRMLDNKDVDDLQPAIISSDKAAIRARRLLRQLIARDARGGLLKPTAEPPLDLLARNGASCNPVLPVV